MKKKIKAFTLVELIVVMAIMAILMAALMNFYKPIRTTYVDSTMIENMRTTQDGILEYLTESVRYAEYMTIIDQGAKYEYTYTDDKGTEQTESDNASTPDKAFIAFCRRNNFVDDSGNPDTTKYGDVFKKVHVIVINRSDQYDKNGNLASGKENSYHGRIITNIIDGTTTPASFKNDYGDRTNGVADGKSYMALGGAYYGASEYQIYINPDSWKSNGDYTGNLTFTVKNTLTNNGNVFENGMTVDEVNSVYKVEGDTVVLTTEKSALTKNLKNLDYFMGDGSSVSVIMPGTSGAYPAGSPTPSPSGVQSINKNTYIVYLEPDDER